MSVTSPRTQPLTRDEVRIVGQIGMRRIHAYPLDACRVRHIEREWNGEDFIERDVPFEESRETVYDPIPELFEPLLDELRREWKAWRAGDLDDPDDPDKTILRGLTRMLCKEGREPPKLPGRVRDRQWDYSRQRRRYHSEGCSHCGALFVGQGEYCSTRCFNQSPARLRARAKQIDAKSIKRAKARSGLACQQCGTSLDPQRAGARYCSPRCRMAASRHRRHNQPAVS
jgi:hypothetical protein